MTPESCSACDERAGWSCDTCGLRCANHVRRRRERLVRFACATCGADAVLRRVRRSETTTFRERLKPALTGPLLGRPVLAIILISLVFSASVLFGPFAFLLGFLPLAVLATRYLRATADGEAFDWPPFSEASEEIVRPLARASAALAPAIVLVFFGVYEGVVAPWQIDAERRISLARALLSGPTFWLSVLPSLAWLPLGLLGATLAEQWWDGLDPRRPVRWVKRWPRPYGWMALVTGAGFLASFLVRWLFSPGWFGAFAASLVAVYAVFAVARLAGELVWLHPDAFGWGRDDDAWMELGDPDAPALEEERAPAAASGPMHTSLEGQVASALDAKDVRLVLQLFVAHKEEAQGIASPVLLRVGQAAASVSEYATAMDALLAAARGTGPDSAKALVIAGRILDERLRDHAGAKRLYEQVVARFPGTQAEAWARQQLADPRFFARKVSG